MGRSFKKKQKSIRRKGLKKKKKTGKTASKEMKVHERGREAVLRNQV